MCLRKAKNKHYTELLSQIANGKMGGRKTSADTWTNSHWKTGPTRLPAEKDKRYESNWKLTLNAQGPVSPMAKREDNLEAAKATRNLRQQDEQPSNPPILPSYQT